jgi:hypothetical protein
LLNIFTSIPPSGETHRRKKKRFFNYPN